MTFREAKEIYYSPSMNEDERNQYMKSIELIKFVEANQKMLEALEMAIEQEEQEEQNEKKLNGNTLLL